MKNDIRLRAPLVGLVAGSIALAVAGCDSVGTAPPQREPVASQPVGDAPSGDHGSRSAVHPRHRSAQAPAATHEASCSCGAQPSCGRHGSAGHERAPSASHRSPSCARGPEQGLCTGGVARAETNDDDAAGGSAEPIPVGAKARCPVMGNEFTVTEATARSEHEGRHYAFCCSGCKPKFDRAPSEYL